MMVTTISVAMMIGVGMGNKYFASRLARLYLKQNYG